MRAHLIPKVLVAGAGFAGLAAAFALEEDGAEVTIVEARDRVGGRVWTIRDGFAKGQHAEGGADFIEANQDALLGLVRRLKLDTARILRRSFGYYGTTSRGTVGIQSIGRTFAEIGGVMAPLVRDYRVAEQRWDGVIARSLGSQSVSEWLDRIKAAPSLRQRFRGLRGLFLADPEDLSLLALVDFFAEDPWAGLGHTTRIVGGNDRIATTLTHRLRAPIQFNTVLRRVRQTSTRIVSTVETAGGLAEIESDYLVATLPASTLRDVIFEPALPTEQWDAIRQLKYGAATRALLQFERRFWRHKGRPLAFGSDQSTGAVWDGNEQQRGSAGILSLLAGGRASAELQSIIANDGWTGVIDRLKWLGTPTKLLHSRVIQWENDPWARGGYAFFDPSFNPGWRAALARPAGRILFAGEHTSLRWQGYMNGAVETGQRAAAEIRAMTK